MELTADTGLRLNAFTAEPGSPSLDALNLLASWAATPGHQRGGPRSQWPDGWDRVTWAIASSKSTSRTSASNRSYWSPKPACSSALS